MYKVLSKVRAQIHNPIWDNPILVQVLANNIKYKIDQARDQVWAQIMDKGKLFCKESTQVRITVQDKIADKVVDKIGSVKANTWNIMKSGCK